MPYKELKDLPWDSRWLEGTIQWVDEDKMSVMDETYDVNEHSMKSLKLLSEVSDERYKRILVENLELMKKCQLLLSENYTLKAELEPLNEFYDTHFQEHLDEFDNRETYAREVLLKDDS